MALIPPSVIRWFATHHGVATLDDLDRLGVSPAARRRWREDRVIDEVGSGVYRIAGMPANETTDAAVLCASHPTTCITAMPAARLRGLRVRSDDQRLFVLAPHGLHASLPPRVVLQQCRDVLPADYTQFDDGLRVATPPRLAFDAARRLSDAATFALVEEILYRRQARPQDLVQIARRLGRRGRPGSTRFARTLLQRIPGGPAESNTEIRVGQLLRARGIPVVAQLPARLESGDVRFDFAVPELRWAIEVDQDPRHLWSGGVASDLRRDAAATDLWWKVDRITRLDMLVLALRIDELVLIYRELRAAAVAA